MRGVTKAVAGEIEQAVLSLYCIPNGSERRPEVSGSADARCIIGASPRHTATAVHVAAAVAVAVAFAAVDYFYSYY